MQPDAWSATHLIPPEGMRAWAEPNPKLPPAAALAGGVEVEVAQRRGSWARIMLSNGWTAWVDDRLLIPKPPFVPTHEVPPAGLRAWLSPDPKAPVVATLVPGLPLELASKRRKWAKVRASNGFVGWVDRALLIPLEAEPESVPHESTLNGEGVPAVAPALGALRRVASAFRRERVFTVAGGIVVGAAAFPVWSRLSEDMLGFDVPLSFLTDYTNRSDGGIVLGLVLALIGLAGVALGFIRMPQWIGRALGWGVLAAVVLFMAQLVRLLNATIVDEFFSGDILRAMLHNTGPGPVLAAAGAALMISGR